MADIRKEFREKYLTGLEMMQDGSDFRMMTRQVAETIVSMKKKERFTKGIFSWVGFSTYWIKYENVERAAGRTKWSFRGFFRYAVSGFIAFATPLLTSDYSEKYKRKFNAAKFITEKELKEAYVYPEIIH